MLVQRTYVRGSTFPEEEEGGSWPIGSLEENKPIQKGACYRRKSAIRILEDLYYLEELEKES